MELHYRLFAEASEAWAALEIRAAEEALTAFPVEVKQSELGAVLFTNTAEDIDEATSCFATDHDLELIIHAPSGPITHFPIPADGATFRALQDPERIAGS